MRIDLPVRLPMHAVLLELIPVLLETLLHASGAFKLALSISELNAIISRSFEVKIFLFFELVYGTGCRSCLEDIYGSYVLSSCRTIFQIVWDNSSPNK